MSTFAALFAGEVMGITPCKLCWYQRTLLFRLAVILGIAAFGSDLLNHASLNDLVGPQQQ